MYNSTPVRLVERRGDFPSNPQRLLQPQPSPLQAVGQRFAFQVLHDEKIDAALRADIMQGADMRVIQRRNRLRLALHALSEIGSRGEMRRQTLDSHITSQPRVASAVDFPHSACA